MNRLRILITTTEVYEYICMYIIDVAKEGLIHYFLNTLYKITYRAPSSAGISCERFGFGLRWVGLDWGENGIIS